MILELSHLDCSKAQRPLQPEHPNLQSRVVRHPHQAEIQLRSWGGKTTSKLTQNTRVSISGRRLVIRPNFVLVCDSLSGRFDPIVLALCLFDAKKGYFNDFYAKHKIQANNETP
jgi:hypothetical protein